MFQHSNLNLRQNPVVLLNNIAKLPEIFSVQTAQGAITAVLDEVRALGDANLAITHDANLLTSTPAETVARYEEICNIRDKNRAKNLEYKNNHKMPSKFKIGDLVLEKVMTKSVARGVPASLQPRYLGPYIVIQVLDKLVEMRHCLRGHKRIVSADFLKPYYSNDFDYALPPQWDSALKGFI